MHITRRLSGRKKPRRSTLTLDIKIFEMNKKEILEFVKNNPVFALATSFNNVPHVRIMRICRVDEEGGLLFNTKTYKKSFIELSENPNIEMCFYNMQDDIQIRIFGKVEQIDDLDVKKNIVNDFPNLKKIIENHGYDAIVPYCLKNWHFKECKRH
jgi:uncharacterized pyridoxamine 5'-phosphate oxidase family protein